MSGFLHDQELHGGVQGEHLDQDVHAVGQIGGQTAYQPGQRRHDQGGHIQADEVDDEHRHHVDHNGRAQLVVGVKDRLALDNEVHRLGAAVAEQEGEESAQTPVFQGVVKGAPGKGNLGKGAEQQGVADGQHHKVGDGGDVGQQVEQDEFVEIGVFFAPGLDGVDHADPSFLSGQRPRIGDAGPLRWVYFPTHIFAVGTFRITGLSFCSAAPLQPHMLRPERPVSPFYSFFLEAKRLIATASHAIKSNAIRTSTAIITFSHIGLPVGTSIAFEFASAYR